MKTTLTIGLLLMASLQVKAETIRSACTARQTKGITVWTMPSPTHPENRGRDVTCATLYDGENLTNWSAIISGVETNHPPIFTSRDAATTYIANYTVPYVLSRK